MSMKLCKNDSVDIGLKNFVLVIFDPKENHDLIGQKKLQMTKSKPELILIEIFLSKRLQKMYRIQNLKII